MIKVSVPLVRVDVYVYFGQDELPKFKRLALLCGCETIEDGEDS